jgi:hypothetical protein
VKLRLAADRHDLPGLHIGRTAAGAGYRRRRRRAQNDRVYGAGWDDRGLYAGHFHRTGTVCGHHALSYGKEKLAWLQAHHEELMEKAKKVESQDIDAELEYELQKSRDAE